MMPDAAKSIAISSGKRGRRARMPGPPQPEIGRFRARHLAPERERIGCARDRADADAALATAA